MKTKIILSSLFVILVTGLCLNAQTRYIDFSIAEAKNNGCSKDTSSIVIGTKDIENEGVFKIYPNPVNDIVILESENRNEMISSLNILDVTGRKVLKFQNLTLSPSAELNLSELNNGIYFMVISLKSHSETLKFIIRE